MKILSALTAAAFVFTVSGCGEAAIAAFHGPVGPDKTRDRGAATPSISAS